MVATGTLRFIDGAETGGLDLTISTGNTPTVVGSIASPAGRSGAFYYYLEGAALGGDQISLPMGYGSGGTALDTSTGLTDDHFLVGFAVKVNALGSNSGAFRVYDEADSIICAIEPTVDGDLHIEDANAGTVGTDDAGVFTAGEWVYIEFAFQHSSSASWEVWANGTSLRSGSGADFQNVAGDDPYRLFFSGGGTLSHWSLDDIYVVSHTSTLQGNNLYDGDGPQVFAYQADIADAASAWVGAGQDDALDISDDANDYWADSAETPFVSSTWSGYGFQGPFGGLRIFDTNSSDNSAHDGGPASHPTYDVSGTIEGSMFVGIYQRGTGGGTTHTLKASISSETTSTADGIVMDEIANSTDTLRGYIGRELSGSIPDATEDFAMGAGTSGSQDIEIREQWAFLLHTPAAGPERVPQSTVLGNRLARQRRQPIRGF